jgi:hypothetical protein
VDGGIDGAQLEDLGTGGGDEAPVGGAAGGGQLGGLAGDGGDGLGGGVDQLAGGGQEGVAGEAPVELVVQAGVVEDGVDALLDAGLGLLGGEAQVEQCRQLCGDDVVGAGAGVDVGDLEAGGREVVVAQVPLLGAEAGQGRGESMHRVVRELRVGDVALAAVDAEHAVEAAAAAVLDDVAQAGLAGGLAHQAVVDALVALAEALDDADGAVDGRAFLVAGDEQRDAAGVVSGGWR